MSWAAEWRDCENRLKIPDRLRKVRVIDWDVFQKICYSDYSYLAKWVMRGDALLLKGAFTKDFVEGMRQKTIEWERSKEQSFHKMLDGCPDFHRKIDIETGKKYSILACKHSAYFFRWNDDPLDLWPTITERWRIIKIFLGLTATEYENNKPSDGPTDRIQVVRYLPGTGYLEPHRDAYTNQRCFISGYMSKRGVDYQGGGFYFVDENNKPVFVEDQIDVGDICIGHANLLHGVAPCDLDKPAYWDATNGRWFLGLYSNDSDYQEKRVTARPEKVIVEGVYPECVQR